MQDSHVARPLSQGTRDDDTTFRSSGSGSKIQVQKYQPRRPQIREKPKNRRPRHYWSDLKNVEAELRELWDLNNISIPHNQPPPIPNESLLNHWKRYDLRAAIVSHGGRDELAQALGGSFIIPGKWLEAIETPYLQALLQEDDTLNAEVPPLSPQQLKQGKKRGGPKTKVAKKISERKPAGYWTTTSVIQELYGFLETRQETHLLPPVWMPRLGDLNRAGRTDLHNAVQRLGGAKRICQRAGLVPFREWNYIEGMLDLLVGLRSYLDEYYNGDYSVFPIVYEMNDRGYERLNLLVQFYGGRKFLASRLDMEDPHLKARRNKLSEGSQEASGSNWGTFDLEFGIELLEFVRNQHMTKKPPLSNPVIEMPTRNLLLAHGEKGERLDKRIVEYGGYENVARRLGLEYFVQ